MRSRMVEMVTDTHQLLFLKGFVVKGRGPACNQAEPVLVFGPSNIHHANVRGVQTPHQNN